MPKKTRKVGRPKMSIQKAKAQIVPVRLNPDTLGMINAAAKARKVTRSEWIRSTLVSAIEAMSEGVQWSN